MTGIVGHRREPVAIGDEIATQAGIVAWRERGLSDRRGQRCAAGS
jgi:hypothetical protein